MKRRVVVTGRGVVSPLGIGLERHCTALREGKSAVRPLPRLVELGLPASRGAEIDPEALAPLLSRLPRKQQKLYNRTTLLAMLASALAVEDAQLAGVSSAPTRLGVLLGVNALSWEMSAMVEFLAATESAERPGSLDMAAANAFCMRNINPLDYSLKTLPNLAAGHLAIAHDAQGVCRALTEGPVGGTHAIGEAFRMIQEGDLDRALCGGADAPLEGLFYAPSAGAGLCATDDGVHAGPVFGEGAGVAVLEAAEVAAARGARAYAAVVAFATAAGDGRVAPDDDGRRLGERLARLLAEVVAEAGGPPELVALQGDDFPAHEAAEEVALARVLGGAAGEVPRLRMKRASGDLGAASGPVEFLACSAALEEGNIRTWISGISGISGKPHNPSVSNAPPHRALVVSLGLFGECAALMLETAGITENSRDGRESRADVARGLVRGADAG